MLGYSTDLPPSCKVNVCIIIAIDLLSSDEVQKHSVLLVPQ